MLANQFCRVVGTIGIGVGLALTLSGCSRMTVIGFDTKLATGSVSLVDRCSDFMHRAFPETPIDISGSHVDAATSTTIVTVQGVRENVPPNSPYAREVAAECRFDSEILTSFRWTLGPTRSPGTAATP
jgi:hypothetical protein